MSRSKELFERAKKVIPGGVNSPVRAFGSVGIDPIFIDRGNGARVTDVDGKEYIDFVCSWGPLIFGHSNEELVKGIEEVVMKGTSFGIPTEMEVIMAELITEAVPSVEMVRMVNSGTEATMSAIRLARAYTKKNKFIKFAGCYHGHSDALLVKSGSGTLTFSVPTSLGVPEEVIKDTLVASYNDLESVKALYEEHKDEIAAIILEPIAGNMGVVPPTKEFVDGLRKITEDNKSLLIFDEVITGFRVAFGGAQELFGITPDLTCFGKIIGGGLPVGAYGGKKEIMNMISPLGGVYQAGTLSGNPLAMYMGYKTLTKLKETPAIYKDMEDKAIFMENRINEIIKRLDAPLTVTRFKGMLCLFFVKADIKSYDDVAGADTVKYGEFFRMMLNEGVLLPPAQFEGLFLSSAHTYEDIEYALNKFDEVLSKLYS